ncbi:hypothetical protein JX265_009235 [Neoarthrinium moseri]|uniref:C2H2-type domain-containing protein n=1 Tax=Neoarthrinium moseri TaxID=1658444 RepID=A0A9P9WGN9_9PEZI|nr:uncharacterized protein JN550_006597 [Neoarthrinium moseri]KAI1847807.1 hypothetical protein JX266_006302 [Neoarthrinium moseri]KAI1862521.1 hypothetical protein JX265_009235 [Neoarthrinium moseri]KAI1868109.1 hypothetical protein JN550_006597 [Neoarthrinium moseri]
MYLSAAQQPQHREFVQHPASVPRAATLQLGSRSPDLRSMERSAQEYSQSGLPSPYPSVLGDSQSEASSADHASAAQYSSSGEPRSANYSTSATPTSEYGVYPPSARSGSFPEHIQRASYHPASNHGGSSGGMAQTPTSPSMPSQDGRNHQPQQVKSNDDIPLDPSLAAPSPTYGQSQYSPYGPPQHHDNMQSYPQSGSLYPQARPDWGAYGQPGQMHPHHPYPPTPTSVAPPGRPAQVYSFVPIPGAQQHKRPRRRYEEIERMYKCGWNGCEKAYGTLNHLNAHVTMQSHGQKRTPEEFKEIRKEWKARKKQEEADRKAAEEAERQRQAQEAAAHNGAPGPEAAAGQPGQPYGSGSLPPIRYPTAGSQYPAPPSSVPQQPLPEYTSPTNSMYPGHYPPASPYAAPGQQQMYSQRQ